MNNWTISSHIVYFQWFTFRLSLSRKSNREISKNRPTTGISIRSFVRNVFNQHRWRFVSFFLVGSDRDEQQHYAEYRSVGVIESSPNPLLSLVFQRLLHHTRVFANCVLHTHIHATYEHTFNIYIYIYTSRNDGNLVTKDRPIKQIFTLPVSFNRRRSTIDW